MTRDPFADADARKLQQLVEETADRNCIGVPVDVFFGEGLPEFKGQRSWVELLDRDLGPRRSHQSRRPMVHEDRQHLGISHQ